MDIPRTSGNYVLLARLNQEVELDLKTLDGLICQRGFIATAEVPMDRGIVCSYQPSSAERYSSILAFDYLKDYLEILEVWWREDSENLECDIMQALLKIPGVQVPVKGFGSSDCRKGCPAHLVQFPLSADPAFIAERLQETWPAFLPMFPAE
jgi:hypothetical protein